MYQNIPISHQKESSGYSMEASRRDASNEYPQQILFMYSKKTMIVSGENMSRLGL